MKRIFATSLCAVAIAVPICFISISRAEENASEQRIKWFKEARFGVFIHFLVGTAPRDMKIVDEFDVKHLAGQLEQIGARYVIITLGQNNGSYIAPNEAYNSATGYAAGERCSQRDVPMELFRELAPRGIKLMLYLPCQPANKDRRAQAAFGLTPGSGDQRLTLAAAEKWAAVIREWSLRYGDRVSGWWLDGANPKSTDITEEIANIYAKAVRAGNPNSIVTFNPASRGPADTYSCADYTAGDCKEPTSYVPDPAHPTRSQWHILACMGTSWGHRNLRHETAQWSEWLKKVFNNGAVVTLEMGPNKHAEPGNPVGSFSAEQMTQILELKPVLTGPAPSNTPRP